MTTPPITLGDRYRDTITGFEGTATSRSVFLFGCVRIQLECGNDGKAESEWFDEQRLVTVNRAEKPAPTATSGGPQTPPPRRDPS